MPGSLQTTGCKAPSMMEANYTRPSTPSMKAKQVVQSPPRKKSIGGWDCWLTQFRFGAMDPRKDRRRFDESMKIQRRRSMLDIIKHTCIYFIKYQRISLYQLGNCKRISQRTRPKNKQKKGKKSHFILYLAAACQEMCKSRNIKGNYQTLMLSASVSGCL